KKPTILDKTETETLVKKILNFTVAINFNAQHCLISRKQIDRMRTYGSFYQSPYPDYYSTTALFLKAERILAVPYPLVAIGISPKSFGSYYHHQKEKIGTAFLKTSFSEPTYSQIQSLILDGTDMNTSWLLAAEKIKQNFEK